MPAKGPADTPTRPTALWMYSLRQLSMACFSRPGKLWLYSGATITSPSAAATSAENVGLLIASPASSTGSGSAAMSITSLRTPARRFSKLASRLAACTLARPFRLVPRMTGMFSGRSFMMSQSSFDDGPPGRGVGSHHEPAAETGNGASQIDRLASHRESLVGERFAG